MNKDKKQSWYALDTNRPSGGGLDVFILEEIGMWGVSASDFIRDVNEQLQDGEELRVHLNTPGGSVFDGLAIYNFLRTKDNVTTIVDGIAASMGSVIFMAGSNRIQPENALLMIHNPWSCACGDSDDLRKMAEALDKMRDSIAGIYAREGNIDIDEVKVMMDDESWLNGVDSESKGFATMTTEAVKIAASFDVAKLGKKIPDSVAKDQTNKEKNMDELKKVQAELAEANTKLTDVNAKLEAAEKDYEAKAKESHKAGIEAGVDEGLGKVKARMEKYKDAKFVIETIDLDDGEVKDKYIERLETENKVKSDALAKLDIDDGHAAIDTDDNGQADPIKIAAQKDVTEQRNARATELKAEGKTAEEAWRIVDAEMPIKETE